MALIPPEYLKSVVALGVQNNLQRIIPTEQLMSMRATGFLYAYPKSGEIGNTDGGFLLWLVTCKHVVEGVLKENKSELIARLNKLNSQGMHPFRVDLSQSGQARYGYFVHPTADVAVMSASWEKLNVRGIQWQPFTAGRNALTRQDAYNTRLSEGDEVFILGFPVGWMPGRQDYPIVRHGVLAQIQGWLNREHDTFLLDGSVFPGNSGGPVVTRPQTEAVVGTQAIPKSCLIGMTSAYKLNTSILERENADLGIVIPMETINETIQSAMLKLSIL